MRALIAMALLALGAVVMLCSGIGMLLTRDALNRVHFLGTAGTLGAACIGTAIIVAEGATALTEGAAAVTFIVAVSGPVLAHYLARAVFQVERGGRAAE